MLSHYVQQIKTLYSKKTIDIGRLREVASDWGQNDYYDKAEDSDWLLPFWGETSPILRLFRELDTTSLAELACGHGRHAAQILTGNYTAIPSRLFLLDVDRENVSCSARRFANMDLVKVFRNNGFDFRPLKDSSLSAVFCYDAMVHFEYDCVISYLKDTYRVLKPGGRALFHHSNYDKNPGSCYRDNPHWRNFMTSSLFSHVAQRAGMRVLEQVILDWGDADKEDGIDCVTLLERPIRLSGEPNEGRFASLHPSWKRYLASGIRRLKAIRRAP